MSPLDCPAAWLRPRDTRFYFAAKIITVPLRPAVLNFRIATSRFHGTKLQSMFEENSRNNS